MKKLEWGLDMIQTLDVQRACSAVSARIAAAVKAKAATAVIYKCPADEVAFEALTANYCARPEADWSDVLAAETAPVLTGTARMVALNCVQRSHADKLVIQFINWEPHLAIKL